MFSCHAGQELRSCAQRRSLKGGLMLPGVSMTLEKRGGGLGNDSVMTPFFEGHGDSRYKEALAFQSNMGCVQSGTLALLVVCVLILLSKRVCLHIEAFSNASAMRGQDPKWYDRLATGKNSADKEQNFVLLKLPYPSLTRPIFMLLCCTWREKTPYDMPQFAFAVKQTNGPSRMPMQKNSNVSYTPLFNRDCQTRGPVSYKYQSVSELLSPLSLIFV